MRRVGSISYQSFTHREVNASHCGQRYPDHSGHLKADPGHQARGALYTGECLSGNIPVNRFLSFPESKHLTEKHYTVSGGRKSARSYHAGGH